MMAPHVSLLYAVGRQHTVIAFAAADLQAIVRDCRADVREPEYILERPAIACPVAGGNWLRVPEWKVEDL